jgi:ABC-type multidrug transport system permease subunit
MTAVAARAVGRPSSGALLLGQIRFAVVDLWRARVVMVFTVAIPLVWLLVIGFIAGNDAVDESTGVRVMQFVTPMAAAMGILYAAYPTVAISLAQARETGVLKRVRGTPLPAWIHVAGRIGGAAVFALGSVAVMFGVGVLLYDVQILGRTFLATVVTVVVAIAAFAALGTAFAALARTASVAQAGSIATAVVLTFVSGLFSFGGSTPPWMVTLGDALPLKPVADSLADQFNPFHTGSGWDLPRLGVVAAWGLVALLVSVRAFRWEPQAPRRERDEATAARTRTGSAGTDPQTRADRGQASVVTTTPRSAPAQVARTVVTGRRRPVAILLDQTVAAARSTWRDGGSLFFALIMPVGLYAFMLSTQGSAFEVEGMRFSLFFAAGMATWGASVVAFMNLPEAVATARDKGVLKRLRGTPVTPWQYLAARMVVAVVLALVIAAAILVVGVLGYDVELTAGALGSALVVVVVGTLSMAACGFALAAFAPSARAVGAVGLVVLLPLAFFSEVFVVGGPAWMGTVGSLFPLKHFQNALAAALGLPGAPLDGPHLAVLALWAVGAGLVALRFFRWDTRSG